MNEPVGLNVKFPILSVSFVLAFFLWIVVKLIAPANVRYEQVPVIPFNADNIDKSLIIEPPDKVGVEISGPEDVLADAVEDVTKRGVVAAYVDLTNAHPGDDDYPLRLTYAKQDLPYKVSLVYPTLSVNITRRLVEQFHVTTEQAGQIPQELGLITNGLTPEPSTITVNGPATAVREVKEVRALVDLSQVTGSTALPIGLEALDDKGQSVSDVTITPNTISVAVGVAPADQSETVIVDPMLGSPPVGYSVVDRWVEPNMIAVEGAPDALAKVHRIPTKPIDLKNVTSSTTLEVPLDVPADVKSYSVQKVKVHVTIEPNSVAGSAPQTVSGP